MNVVEGSWYVVQHKAIRRAGNIRNQRKKPGGELERKKGAEQREP